MPEEKVDVAEETESVVNSEIADSDIPARESSPETTEDSDTEETAADAGKKAETSEVDDSEVTDDGKPIPFERFKKVIGQRNTLRSDHEATQAELKEAQTFLNHPDVFRAALKTKGLTKEAIDAKMKEAGFEVKDDIPKDEVFKQIKQGLDLNSAEGWFEAMRRIAQMEAKGLVAPVSQEISQRKMDDFVRNEESKAKEFAGSLGIEYGENGKSERDINTAVGMIAKYLNENPEDARLGHFKILKLAVSGKGLKLGEQQGVKKEKDRNQALKDSQMETSEGGGKEEEPSGEWSTQRLMEWSQKHNK